MSHSESSPLSPPGPSADPPVTRALGGKVPDPSTVVPTGAGPSGGRSPDSQHLCALRGVGGRASWDESPDIP